MVYKIDCGENIVIIPLSMMQDGEEGRLAYIHGGYGLRRRLAEMGFVKGVKIRVIGNSFRGQVVVIVNGSKYALGRGMAMKIMVEVP